MYDIVLPSNNESEFIEIASRLGIKKLYFLYDFDYYDEQSSSKKLEQLTDKKINIETGFIVNQKNLKRADNKSKVLVAKSSSNDRFFIESKKIKMIYGFEELCKKDYVSQRASGLNHVMCEMLNKNKLNVGFSYSLLFKKSSQEASILMGRMLQNIRLCQKHKVGMVAGSFSSEPFDLRAPHDVMSLLSVLGMDRKIIKESM